MEIGKRILFLRQQQNLKAVHLANAVGISTGYVSDVEKGVKTPTIETLEKICTALNVTMFEFFRPDTEEAVILTNELKQLISSAKNLTPEQLDKLNEFVKTIKL